MIVDNNLLVSGSISGNTVTGQTVTGTGFVYSTNAIDLLQARDIGEGEDLFMRSEVVTAVAGPTTIEIQAVVADDAGLTSNLAVVGTTGAIPVASLTAGARFAAKVNPRMGSKGQRYLGVRYYINGTGTAGAFVTDFGIEVQDGQKFYNSGFAVL
jgi:phosphohistidine swiveling domain-containing protein